MALPHSTDAMMAGSYYDLNLYDEMQGEAPLPSLGNLLAAACFINGLFRQSGFHCAAQGGLAMLCRGSSRETADVNIATDASMRQLWKILEPSPGQVPSRLRIPNTKLVDKVVRVLVSTGPQYGDLWCDEGAEIEVDLNVFDCRRVSSTFASHIEAVEIVFQGRHFEIQILDIAYMMKTKLRTLTSRGAQKDFDDTEYLLTSYADQIRAIANQLDLQDRAQFFQTKQLQSNHPLTLGLYRTVLEL